MNATRKVKLKEMSPNLTCNLCKGYFIDATTIIECLHSFCKSCIVNHLEKSEYCPVCDVQLHSSKPLSSIRSDQMLQEIVYKLVPGLFQNEMARRRKFYKEHPDSTPSSQEDSGHVYNESYITSDDIIHLSLEYYSEDIKFRESTKRFIKCPAAVSISILKKLIQGKYDLNSGVHIDVMYGDRILPDDFLLMDIAYKYSWTQNGKPLQLCYRVKGVPPSWYSGFVKITDPQPIETKVDIPTPAPVAKRRQSRNSTSNPTTSINSNQKDTVKSKTTKIAPVSTTTVPTPKAKTPARGRRKRKTIDEDTNANAKTKEQKPPKEDKKEKSKETLSLLKETKQEVASTSTSSSECKEVQLRISETGVISARSVLSGEEKIIGSVASGNSNSSTASLRNQVANSSPAKVTNHLSTASSSSLHQIRTNTLTIPSPVDAINRANAHSNNANMTVGNSFSGSPIAKISLPPGTKLTPLKRKNSDQSLTESPGGKIKAQVKNNSDKCANVKKAMSDLEKKLQNNGGKGKYAKKLTTTVNLFPIPSNSTPGQTNSTQTQMNGSHKHSLPIPPPVPSAVPTSNPTNGSNFNESLNSPNKRFPHHTTATVINGDLKFTTSPKNLHSPSKESQSFLSSPKKPPKFFKSRHSNAIVSPCDVESPLIKSAEKKTPENKIKNPSGVGHTTGNGGSKSSQDSGSTVMTSTNSTTTAITTTAGFGGPAPFRLPPNIANTLTAMNMNMNMNTLNMSIAAAAAASTGVPMNLVPFVTSNYCSMPFLNNPRNPFNMNMNLSHLPFPFAYPGVSVPTSTSNSSTQIKNGNSLHLVSSANNIMSPNNPSIGGNSATLDLSLGKNKAELQLQQGSGSSGGVKLVYSNGGEQTQPLSLIMSHGVNSDRNQTTSDYVNSRLGKYTPISPRPPSLLNMRLNNSSPSGTGNVSPAHKSPSCTPMKNLSSNTKAPDLSTTTTNSSNANVRNNGNKSEKSPDKKDIGGNGGGSSSGGAVNKLTSTSTEQSKVKVDDNNSTTNNNNSTKHTNNNNNHNHSDNNNASNVNVSVNGSNSNARRKSSPSPCKNGKNDSHNNNNVHDASNGNCSNEGLITNANNPSTNANGSLLGINLDANKASVNSAPSSSSTSA